MKLITWYSIFHVSWQLPVQEIFLHFGTWRLISGRRNPEPIYSQF